MCGNANSDLTLKAVKTEDTYDPNQFGVTVVPNMRNITGLKKITDSIQNHYIYTEDNKLGEGAYGKVYIAKNKEFQRLKVALKVISKELLE